MIGQLFGILKHYFLYNLLDNDKMADLHNSELLYKVSLSIFVFLERSQKTATINGCAVYV